MTTKNLKKGLTGEQVLEKEGRNGLNNSPKSTLNLYLEAFREMFEFLEVKLLCVVAIIATILFCMGKVDFESFYISAGSILTGIFVIPLIVVGVKKKVGIVKANS